LVELLEFAENCFQKYYSNANYETLYVTLYVTPYVILYKCYMIKKIKNIIPLYNMFGNENKRKMSECSASAFFVAHLQ